MHRHLFLLTSNSVPEQQNNALLFKFWIIGIGEMRMHFIASNGESCCDGRYMGINVSLSLLFLFVLFITLLGGL